MVIQISALSQLVELSPPRAIFDRAQQYSGVIDLTLGDPDLPPPTNVREAACHAVMAGKTRYSANAGLVELRRKIARAVRPLYGFEPDPQTEIIATVGAIEAAFLAMICTVNPGDEVIIHAPFWINYVQIVKMVRAVPVLVYTRPEDQFQLSTEAVERAITAKTRVIVLNSPNNPTGAIIPDCTLQKIAALAKLHDITVFSDEIYRTLIYDDRPFHSICALPGMRECTVVVDGFSKQFAMTGWRLGYALAPAALVSQMTKLQENVAACAPLPSQYAGIEALSERTDYSYIRREFCSRRDLVFREINRIPGLRCYPIPATFYAMVDISSTGMSSRDFAYDLLDREHVAVIPGAAYGGPCYDHLIRIAFTMKNELLADACTRIARYMRRLRDQKNITRDREFPPVAQRGNP